MLMRLFGSWDPQTDPQLHPALSLSAVSVQLQSEGIMKAVDELFEALNH